MRGPAPGGRSLLRLALAALAWLVAVAGSEAAPWTLRVFAGDGLPDKHVKGITQTPDGWLWVATTRHLARFDGVRFEAVPIQAFTGGLSPRIAGLLGGRDGLWLPTDEGPVVHVGASRLRSMTNGVPRLVVDDAVEDGQGALWVVYRRGDVYRVRDGRAVAFGPKEGVPPAVSRASLAVDRSGRIWMLKAGRVLRFEGERFEPVAALEDVPSRLAPARRGGVWIAAPPHLLNCDENGVTTRRALMPPEHQLSRPHVLYEDGVGALWIGMAFSGLVRYHEDRFENIPTSHRGIVSLFEDREGTLWVGTAGGGLNRIQPRVIALEGRESALPGQQVQSIAEDAEGVLWGARPSGELVFRRNDEDGWRVSSTGRERHGAATAVAADGKGALFVGTRGSLLLHRLQDGRWTTWDRQQGFVVHNTCALVATRGGDVWIGGDGPPIVLRLRADVLRRFDLPPGTRYVRAMVEDAGGNVWIGADQGVLLRARGDEWIDETPRAPGAKAAAIRALHASADGVLWIGYDDGGLGRLHDGRFARFGADQGLSVPSVIAIFEGGGGRLWLATEAGFLVLRTKQLEDVAAGRAARVEPVWSAAEEPMPSLPAGFCGWTGPVRARDGRIFVPLGNTLAVVEPSQQPRPLGAPPVAITRVLVDGEIAAVDAGWLPAEAFGAAVNLTRTPRVSLAPRHRRLEVDVSALSLRTPENVRFRHRLEGLDDTWTTQTARRISYSRLPAGRYRLHVTACGSDGTWNEAGAALEITVAPFLWQTVWFRAGALLLFGGLVAAAIRVVSLRQLRARLAEAERQAAFDRERTRIARDIHDDVGNQLMRITLLGELSLRDLGEPAGPVGARVREISSAVHEVTEALDEIVWAVNPGHDTLPHLLNRIAQFTVDYLRTAGVTARLDLPENPPDWTVSAEVRHNLFLAFKEALTNAVRHAQATTIDVAASVTNDALTLVVSDDGRGFTPGPASAMADGLRNMDARVRDLGGDMALRTAPGSGTRVAFRVPWPREGG